MSEKKSRKKIVIILLVVAILGAAAFALLYDPVPDPISYEMAEEEGTVNPLTGLAEESLPSRPVMVSTDNVGDAIPQYGISQADIIYEVPVEGAQSRLECLYYSDMPEKVGPTRSVRPCIVDIAREWKAILVHDGWSPAARKYLSTGVVADLPAQTQSFYYRISSKSAPHNELAKMDDVWKAAEKNGFDEKQELRAFKFMNEQEQAVFSGTQEEYLAGIEEQLKEQLTHPKQEYILPDLSGITMPESEKAATINVKYANCASAFSYSSKTGKYTRTVNGGEYKDLNNGKKVKVANVIVYKVSSEVLDYKGRLDIDMCAGGKAWVFTGGRVIEGKWSREDLDSPTIFKDKDGNEIMLSQGKTWIYIIDGDSSFSFK